MALFLKHTDTTGLWGVWKTDESVEQLLALLPHSEAYRQQALQRFKTEHRQQEWISVRVLLYTLLGEEKEIAYTSQGKPLLADGSYHISISHTKGYVAVILSAQSQVGIDIEQYGDRIRKVAHKFVRADEVIAAYQDDETWGLLLNWSAKEVMFKCMDAEGVDFREHLHIEPFRISGTVGAEGYPQGIFLSHEYKTERQRTFEIHYLLHPHFVLTYYIEH